MAEESRVQILKCCDDPVPVYFRRDDSVDDCQFTLTDNSSCSWLKKEERFGIEELRKRIEPWLTALCQSEHLSLLLGAGLSYAIQFIATGHCTPMMSLASFGRFSDVIAKEVKRSALATNRKNGNIEDQIRVANELLRGLQILSLSKKSLHKTVEGLSRRLDKVLAEFADAILKAEREVIRADREPRERAFNYLVSFLMSFASRAGTRDRLHIFTTNYDRFIEAGAEIAGLRLLDRFVGSLVPIFHASRLELDLHYNPPGIRGEPRYVEGVARFTKLHGSLDWVDCDRAIRRIGIPLGADSVEDYLKLIGAGSLNATRLMIYPNAAKDRETAFYPYAEMFRDFAAAVCRPNHTLIVFGYSFGDEHIVRIIEDMLTIPSTHLVIMARGDTLNRIMDTYERVGRPAQITLLIGDHVGDFRTLVDHYLPKPAIDRTTFRMAELLRARWPLEQTRAGSSEVDSARGEEPA